MVFSMVFNMTNIKKFQYILKFRHIFQHALEFSTHTKIFNMLFQHSFQHILQFSTCLEICNMFLNTPWNIQHSFEPVLQFSTCTEIFNTLFQHVLQFSEHAEIFNILFYSFQNMLKISTCFSQFSEHAENFNMLIYGFQHSFSICFQNVLQISIHSEIFNTLSNMKIWNIYSQIVTEPF